MVDETIETEEVVIDEVSDEEVYVEEETPIDEEKEALKQKVAELTNKNQSLYQKMKSGYKKHADTKEIIKKEFVSKDEVRGLIEQVQKDKEDESKLVEKFEDAKDLLPEAKKLAQEKGLDIYSAYHLIKGKMLDDEGYRNQILGERSANYGEFRKKTSTIADDIFSKGPRISTPIKDN